MTRATLNRPTNPTTGGAESMKAIVRNEDATTPENVLRRGEINRPADANQSIRKASTTAGVGLLLMSALSTFGYLVAVRGLVVPGNAARTATNIAGHEGLFRFGILSLSLVVALDVVVAWALYRVFKPVSEGISRLTAWLRIAYAGIFMVAISQLVGVFRLLGNTGHFGIVRSDQLHAQVLLHINTFTNIWDAGLVLFGLDLFGLAYLAYRSGYVPKLLGILLAIAGFGYVFDTVTRVLVRGSSSDVSAITGIGEFVFALWLVIRGRRIAMSNSGSHDGSIGAAR
ncbi:MAG: DUF4386 domain-containing protein [Acidimicrobiales bacterium]